MLQGQRTRDVYLADQGASGHGLVQRTEPPGTQSPGSSALTAAVLERWRGPWPGSPPDVLVQARIAHNDRVMGTTACAVEDDPGCGGTTRRAVTDSSPLVDGPRRWPAAQPSPPCTSPPGRGLRRSSRREKSAASQPCCCQYAAADRTASSETFHVDAAGAPTGRRTARRTVPGRPHRARRRRRTRPRPSAGSARRSGGCWPAGAAQGGQVGIGGLAEGDATGGRGEAADRFHGRTLSKVMTHYL